ncbi:MAG: hypothetical protein ACC641_05020 [Acidiferrobacterales bacterium]
MHKYKFLVLLFSVAVTNSALAGLAIYPSKGQSAEQQKKDETECYTWAVQQKGYDPAKPSSAQKDTAPAGKSGGAKGGRLRGAAKGAIIGEITNVDTRDAAIAGAVIGGSRQRRQQRKAEQQAQAAAEQKKQSEKNEFNKARAVCLEGRGYSVK